MKKQLISMAMATMMVLTSLTACSSKPAASDSTTTAAIQETTTAAPETTAATQETTTAAPETTAAQQAAADDDGKVYKIGVLQLTQHSALDASNEGFIAALNDSGIKYEVDQKNAAGEQSTCQTVAEQFVNDQKDLILAIATPAAQACAAATSDIPIILTAVTDPAESGLVADNAAPGANVTGTSDLTPVKEQIDLLQKILPEAKTVGILYSSAEANSRIQAEMADAACAEVGLATKHYTVSTSNEIQSVVESMVGDVDVIYSPTDNVIAAGMATVAMIAADNNLPTIVGEEGMVDAGGLATYGIDYFQLGYLAGQQAIDILTGKTTAAETPIGYLSADKCELKVNADTASVLGIDVSGLE